jgi:beta-N-acetylhexosaminidase
LSGPDAEPPCAVIFGCAGPVLTDAERALFARVRPLGFILFARNCEAPDQVRQLVAALRETAGDEAAPVLIDQEGGRVARLGPPHWRRPPPMGDFAALAAVDADAGREACFLNARMIGAELAALGITVDCAPVLDIPAPDGHDIIGDRALGGDVETVSMLGRAVCDGLLAEAVIPVVKHVPGHGRARADSHRELPVVDAAAEDLRRIDFAPFRRLFDAPWAMTAHILYTALDAKRPASASPDIIADVVRGDIGFDGFLVSDDLGMEALTGPMGERARAVVEAGCDAALHCSGRLDEMEAVADVAPRLTEGALERLARAELQRTSARKPAERRAAARLADLLAHTGKAASA